MTQETLMVEFRRMRNKKALFCLAFAGAVLYMLPWHGYILATLGAGILVGWFAKDAVSLQNSLFMVQTMEWPQATPPPGSED